MKSNKYNYSLVNDSIIQESVAESDKLAEAGPTMPFNNSIAMDSTMRRTTTTLQKRIEAKDMFP